jgi:hypothetical protein
VADKETVAIQKVKVKGDLKHPKSLRGHARNQENEAICPLSLGALF